jgi:hypothetical protein
MIFVAPAFANPWQRLSFHDTRAHKNAVPEHDLDQPTTMPDLTGTVTRHTGTLSFFVSSSLATSR